MFQLTNRLYKPIKIKRRALLIGAPGQGRDFLHGVSKDLLNMRNYLLSDLGGAWEAEEIVTLYNPSYEEVNSLVHNESADYSFIYLSGHGCTGRNDKRMFFLKDKYVRDIFFLNNTARQLIIIDACRTIFRGVGAPAPESFSPSWEKLSRIQIRQLFDNYITNSPPGKIIIYSTKYGEPSYDNLRGDGGVFTLSLLKAAINSKSADNSYAAITIRDLFGKIRTELKKEGRNQIPCVVYKTGDLNVPFVISPPLPAPIKVNNWPIDYSRSVRVPSENSGGGLLLGIILLIALFDD